jgi:hypothetical protein
LTQDQAIILALRVVLVSDVAAVAGFIAQYWRLAKWWKNPIGRTLIVKDILLILCLMPSILSLFWHFSRLTSHIAAWFDVASFGLITPVMIWRIIVWQKISREDRVPRSQGGGS